MTFQFTHSAWLAALPVALLWVGWLFRISDVQISPWRRWTALVVRAVVVTALCLAIAGLQWKRPREGMNVLFVLDRSDSIPAPQQEAARLYVNKAAAAKDKEKDRGGVVVFGTEAGVEMSANAVLDVQKITSIVPTERTDIAAAIRLGTAAFPETGQKRLVLLTDGNENLGDALTAVLAARNLDVTVDVVPLGAERGSDISVQKFALPSRVKKGQTFEAKVLVNSDKKRRATLRFYRNEEYMGEQQVELDEGRNAFGLPQTLPDPGFYAYNVLIESQGDAIPQNNRASSFVAVRGEPRVLLLSANPAQDTELAAAIGSTKVELKHAGLSGIPATLAELQSYDAVFLSNISAGELGTDTMALIESAVRDFGVGLVCVGGDNAFAAGGYRGTPLEAALPVNMELDSKKVLPNGALALIMHGMEFPGANGVARDTAIAALDALGPQDELGVLLWDGNERWLFPLAKVGDKKAMRTSIAGMNQGDLPNFHNLMNMAHQALKASKANLKHIIVFSDGDPNAPTPELLDAIVGDRITISTVMIGGHVMPDTMLMMADKGKGRFYDVGVKNADKIPEIFIKESAVILKSAIFEQPFKPVAVAQSELTRGFSADAWPRLLGHVCTTPKVRAEVPLVSDKGDPVLAHWNYGLGRAVAFTSDARARWAKDWLGWAQFRQFWAQVTQWSQRRVENADFTTEVTVDRGEGVLSVDAVDEQGNFRNFINLQTVVVSPKGERQVVRLEQTGPGHYEARFPTKETGAYMMNLMEVRDGQPRGSMVLGASVNYSPEFTATEANAHLLRSLAEAGGGQVLDTDPTQRGANPFLRDRRKTFQPVDLHLWLMKFAVLLFLLDVGVRRIQLDREELVRATATLRRWLLPWEGRTRTVEADESLNTLLTRRDEVRARHTAPVTTPLPSPELFRPKTPPASSPTDKPLSAIPPATAVSTPADAPASAASPSAENTMASRLLAARKKEKK